MFKVLDVMRHQQKQLITNDYVIIFESLLINMFNMFAGNSFVGFKYSTRYSYQRVINNFI